MASYEIREARTDEDYDAARQLIVDYIESLPFEITFQDIADELASLPVRYGPPDGATLLAWDEGGAAVGVVALRPLEPGTAEVKRMYVAPEHREARLGRRLMEVLVERARDLGLGRLRLDTMPELVQANALYERLGFVDIPAYNDNPMDGVRFMELRL